jgi:hypothetical protein
MNPNEPEICGHRIYGQPRTAPRCDGKLVWSGSGKDRHGVCPKCGSDLYPYLLADIFSIVPIKKRSGK